jgi:hypothetical protein
MRLSLVAVAVAAALAMGCGGDDQTVEAGNVATTTTAVTATTTTTTTDETTTSLGANPVTGEISLTIRVVSQGAPLRDATITCNEGAASGTGFLADDSAARAACDLLLTNPSAVRRLVEGREPGLMCTQQYGGPEEATVKGTIGGQAVNAGVNRRDGCGIAEWNMLTPLLGSPNT